MGKLKLGKVLSLFVGVSDGDTEEKIEQIREERQKRGEERTETHQIELGKRDKGRRIVAGVNVRDMTEDEFLTLIEEGHGDTG